LFSLKEDVTFSRALPFAGRRRAGDDHVEFAADGFDVSAPCVDTVSYVSRSGSLPDRRALSRSGSAAVWQARKSAFGDGGASTRSLKRRSISAGRLRAKHRERFRWHGRFSSSREPRSAIGDV